MNSAMKCSPGVRERAVRLVFEDQGEHESQWAGIGSIANAAMRRLGSDDPCRPVSYRPDRADRGCRCKRSTHPSSLGREHSALGWQVRGGQSLARMPRRYWRNLHNPSSIFEKQQ